MYVAYWGLSECPFTSAIDPHWFHAGPEHDEAFSRLLFLVESRRQCGVVTGPSGTGKSLLCQVLAEQVSRSAQEVAYIDLVGRSRAEGLWDTAAALRLAPASNASELQIWRLLQDSLQAGVQARLPALLVFDHLDRAEGDCAAMLQRLLHLNLGSAGALTLVLALRAEGLSRDWGWLTEFSDLRIELRRLDRNGVCRYVTSRLRRAGLERDIFDDAAWDELYRQTGGIPRDINRLCDLTLVAGMYEGAHRIDAGMVRAAAEELPTIATRRPRRAHATRPA